MLIHEDYEFTLHSEDDAQEVTCRMCYADCALSGMSDGCCPDCASLCQSAPTNDVDAYTRRSHLVTLTRKAFLLWSDACDLYNERLCAFRPSASCVEEAALLVEHRLRRLNLLESQLADETGLAKFSVYNDIARFPACNRLLTYGL